jgi:Protein kinase domain
VLKEYLKTSNSKYKYKNLYNGFNRAAKLYVMKTNKTIKKDYMKASPRFGYFETDAFMMAFKHFTTANDDGGLDPLKADDKKYRKDIVLAFAQNNTVLKDYPDKKLYNCFQKAARLYLDKKDNTTKITKTDGNEIALLTQTISNQSDFKGTKKVKVPIVPFHEDKIDYTANQESFKRAYKQTDVLLGTGGFANVYQGISFKKEGLLVAIKVPHFCNFFVDIEQFYRMALKEIKIMECLSLKKSPFILEILDSYIVMENQKELVKTVLPFMDHGTLKEYIQMIPDENIHQRNGLCIEETQVVAKQLLMAVAHMSSHKVVSSFWLHLNSEICICFSPL